MNGLCPRCGSPIPIIATQGKEGSSFYAIRRHCTRCKLIATQEFTYDFEDPDDSPPHAHTSSGSHDGK